jgi:hypothetical protein
MPSKLHIVGKELQETNISATQMTALLSAELQTYDEWTYIDKRNGKGGTNKHPTSQKSTKIGPKSPTKSPKLGPRIAKRKRLTMK